MRAGVQVQIFVGNEDVIEDDEVEELDADDEADDEDYEGEIDEEYAKRVGAWVIEQAQREADRAGVPFDPESPLLRARIAIAIEDALDDSECDCGNCCG